MKLNNEVDYNSVQYSDIEQLQKWFIYFFEKLALSNIDKYVDFSNKALWFKKLSTLSRQDIANGFVKYVDLYELAEQNQLEILRLNAFSFKNICQQSI